MTGNGIPAHICYPPRMALTRPIGLSEPEPPQNGDNGAPEGGRVTPMMEQYIEIKAANPDCLLFYRMGDFYELFFEDAEVASRALGIMLTKRGKHLGADIPMCGVPVERADEYLHRLIALGHRVAVCEQLEDPAEARKRGSKAVVRRDVVRLVSYCFFEHFPYRQLHMVWRLQGLWQYLRGDMAWRPLKRQGLESAKAN